MECCNWKMRSVIALFITNLLPLAMTLYEDLGYLCVKDISDEEYKSVQLIISYKATPYPFVTNGTNITLTCAGRSVDFVTIEEDQSYMTNVEFYKNDQPLRNCKEDPYLRFRNLSCNVTVTGVTNNDKFMCIIRASFAPCNAAQLSFQVGNKLPKPKHIYLNKVTSQKAWIGWEAISANTTIHGALLGYKVTLIGKYSITLPNDANNVVLPHLIRKSEYIVTVRGFTQYGEGRILEYNFTTLDVIPAPKKVKITSISANFAVVHWTVIEQQEGKYERVTGYIVTVGSKTYLFNIKASNTSSSVSINNLFSNTSYRVSVVGLSEETEGMPSEWISFKTNLTQDRLGQFPSNDQGESDETKGESNLSLTIVILLGAIILGAIIVSAVFAFFQLRRRKSQDITPNQVVMDNQKRYYNDGALNDPEGTVKVIRYGHFSW